MTISTCLFFARRSCENAQAPAPLGMSPKARHAASLTLLGALVLSSVASAQGTYIEALGASVLLPSTASAVIVNAPQAGLPANGQGNPFQAQPTATQSEEAKSASGTMPALTHDGNVRRQSNVPAPGAAQAQGQPAQSQPQSAGAQTQQAVGQNIAQAGVLPNPNLGAASLINIPEEVLNRLAPATTEQLRAVMKELYLRQGAAVTPWSSSIQSRSSQYPVDLSPGASPPVVRVANGVGSTVSFVDAGGNPWPIEFANNFNSEAATITQMAPHVLSVSSNSPHLTGSVGVILQGLTTPVSFIVTPAQDFADFRADLLVPGLSPDAPPMVGGTSSRPAIGGAGLKDFLYGATPNGSTRLEVGGDGVKSSTTRAWQDAKGNLILRTRARVVSPAWFDMLPALDGTSVYRLPSAPVVRVSVDGQLQTFTIQGLTPIAQKKSDLAANSPR